MGKEEVQQAINDWSEVSKQIMRDIDAICEKMSEAGQGDSTGVTANGWKYSFEKPSKEVDKKLI